MVEFKFNLNDALPPHVELSADVVLTTPEGGVPVTAEFNGRKIQVGVGEVNANGEFTAKLSPDSELAKVWLDKVQVLEAVDMYSLQPKIGQVDLDLVPNTEIDVSKIKRSDKRI